MKVVANYEVRSDMSVFEDLHWLKLKDPKGMFRARVRNIPRSDFSTPFLLSLHLSFEAPNLDEAADIAEEYLADCLNVLSLATGSSFIRHRKRQIVDCTPGLQMRTCLIWGDSIGHEDPTPFLDQRIADSIDRLLSFDASPVVRRAMRWYRMGVNSQIPDDQFQYFWFALELIAINLKSSEKVPDRCPHCRSPLSCETCGKQPVHKPYDKQRIRALIKVVDENCADSTIDMLEQARNSLMHGATLREIEAQFPEPREEIVDVLGKIVFKVLINQFPQELFNERLVIGTPSSYISHTLTGVAHIQTVVPVDAEGELDLSFSGLNVSMVTDAPPQSARPILIGMTVDQYNLLGQISYEVGDH